MKHLNKLLAFSVLLFSAQAQALMITPDSTSLVPGPGCGGDAACILATNSTSTNTIVNYIESTYGVSEEYKSDVVKDSSGVDASGPGDDGGSMAAFYDTVFLDSIDAQLSGADITWNGSDKFSCPDCLLLVKDGNNDPNWYLFDLLGWDGEETLELRNFWIGNGAISHVSIFSESRSVPEPGMVALLAIGLIGMVATRRRAKV